MTQVHRDFTDADAQLFLVRAVQQSEKCEARKAFFSWLRVARRLGITLVHRMILFRYIEWLKKNVTGSVGSFIQLFDIRRFILETLYIYRERQALYASMFPSALQ